MDDGSGFLTLFVVVSLVFTAIASGAMCCDLAKHKGHEPFAAWMTGFFCSWLAVIYYAGLPDRKAQADARAQALVEARRRAADEDTVEVPMPDGTTRRVSRSVLEAAASRRN